MQYMNDPTLRVMHRDQRGLDVNDINGQKKRQMAPMPPAGPIQRVSSVRPHQMEYDIINPSGQQEGSAMRMSGYGKNILQNQSSHNLIQAPAAGTKNVVKQGEANMSEIWPQDEGQRQNFNEKNRIMDTHDINTNKYNPRMQKLREADAARARASMRSHSQAPPSQGSIKQDKNASSIFGHLVDDPSTRAKLGQQRHQQQMPPRAPQPAQIQMDQAAHAYQDQDMLDRMMVQEQQYQQQMNGGGSGLPPSGKRAYRQEHTSVATGMMRLFGGDRGEENAPVDVPQRQGKRQIGLPSQYAVVNVFN